MKQESLIVDADTAEIIRLHEDTRTALQMALETALRIGALLCKHKARLGHGGFLPWVKRELPFSERTARNYMRLHERQAELKSANVADLAGAYRLLAEHKPQAPAKVTTSVEPKSSESVIWETDPLWIPRPGKALWWTSRRPGHEQVDVTISPAVEPDSYYVNIMDGRADSDGFIWTVRPVSSANIGKVLWVNLDRDLSGVSDFMQYADRFEYEAHPWTYNEEAYDNHDDAMKDRTAEAQARRRARVDARVAAEHATARLPPEKP